MKITLIGGNGFIGSHIADRLVMDDMHKVTVFGRSPPPFSPLNKKVDYVLGGFENIDLLRKSLWGADIVVHLLSTTVPATANMDPAYDVHSNIIGTIKLLEEVGKQKIKRLIYVSSGGTVYGNPEYLPMDERHPLQPLDSYGIAKVAIESYVKMYAKKYGFSYTIIRPSNPYGARQSFKGMQGVISTFLFKMLSDQAIVVWGDGKAIRDYVYIDDVVDFFLKVIESEEEGIFNLGYGKGYSVNEIIQTLETITSLVANVSYVENQASHIKDVVLDIENAKNKFGWSPIVDLRAGIDSHYRWLSNEIIERSK